MVEAILSAVWPQLLMLALVYFLVLLVIFLDLWAGIRKAKARGEYRSSYGYRKTVEKIGKYFNMLLVITILDAMQMLAIGQINLQASSSLPIVPICTFIGAIFIGFIELKSIYEKSEDKEKAKIADAAALLGKALKDHDTREVIASVVEYMKTENKQDNDTRTIQQ